MMKNLVISTAVAAVLATGLATPTLADQTGGAVGGAALGSMTEDDRVWERSYVEAHPRRSVAVEEPIMVGKPLPRDVVVYSFDGNPHLSGYRYAYVDERYVLVDRDGVVVETIVD